MIFKKKFDRCWLPNIKSKDWYLKLKKIKYIKYLYLDNKIIINDKKQINNNINLFFKILKIKNNNNIKNSNLIFLIINKKNKNNAFFHYDEFIIIKKKKKIIFINYNKYNILYSLFYFILLIQSNSLNFKIIKKKANINIRMINHWDNLSGDIERGYSGKSIFFKNNNINYNINRINFYIKLLISIGINSICINNVNVDKYGVKILTLNKIKKLVNLAKLFNNYKIKLFISINFDSPKILNKINTSDPLNKNVILWWKKIIKMIYTYIPYFGGFVIKASSEGNVGPIEYGRTHVDGANMFAKILKKYNGYIFWRCFVYNYNQDWKNKLIDRAKSAYDIFYNLNNKFYKNVILQIKYGPMDFQIREPISPLLGIMNNTSQILELQITQEYTGQNIDICWLGLLWKMVLNFDTYLYGKDSFIKKLFIKKYSLKKKILRGITGVSNIGNDYNWTGNYIGQLNLYTYGKLIWNVNINLKKLLKKWIILKFVNYKNNLNKIKIIKNLFYILFNSKKNYENYTVPLGIGWMVNPNNHYGPNVDGYEYSKWGTYHYSNNMSVGINRSLTGTNYVSQYFSPNLENYNSINLCPIKLLLFFHNIKYKDIIYDNISLIQYIYNSHYKGLYYIKKVFLLFKDLKSIISNKVYLNIYKKLKLQYININNWINQINTYFYRKSGIKDYYNRNIII